MTIVIVTMGSVATEVVMGTVVAAVISRNMLGLVEVTVVADSEAIVTMGRESVKIVLSSEAVRGTIVVITTSVILFERSKAS